MWEPQVSVRFSQPPRGSCPERPPRLLAAGGDTPLEPLTLCEPRPDGGHFAVALRPRRPGRTVARPPPQVAACQFPPASPGTLASVRCA